MKRAVLVVLDGFGERREADGNAIRLARTPNFDWLYRDYPHTLILLSVAFAGLAACNLAFLRHLRRAYASPRRSVWRRG